jgi:hypothetical protein
MMNSKIKAVLDGIVLAGAPVPNALMYFDGEADTFMVYSPTSERVGLSGDDVPLDLVESWDIDVYSRENYIELSREIKNAMIAAGWTYRGSSNDTYDEGTKMFHRLLEFEIESDEDLSESEEI